LGSVTVRGDEMKRSIIVAGCAIFLAAGAGVAWHVEERARAELHSKLIDGRPRIEIKNIRAKRRAVEGDGARARVAAHSDEGRPIGVAAADRAPAAPNAVAEEVRTLDGEQYLRDLESAVKLTQEERDHLAVVLRDIDHMQRQIDKKSDSVRRAELQYKLVQQLVVRLRLVLGEQRARTAAAELERDNPRIVFDGSAPI
jgi:hypothetical protein